MILDTAREAFISMDEQGRIVDWNPQAEEAFGWPREEVLGRPLAETLVPERYRQAHREALRRFLATGEGSILGKRVEMTALRADGSELPVELTVVAVKEDASYVFNAFLQDITERKRAEDTIKARTLELEASNAELEAFSYSVSHDLRAPLRSIDGFSQALLEDYDERLDEQGSEFLRRIRSATQRMGLLIDDLLDLSRVTRTELRREQVDLSAIASAIGRDLQQAQPDRQVNLTVEPGLVATADSRLMRTALANLLENAWKFTRNREVAEVRFGLAGSGPEKVFMVKDNGVGFDMRYAEKLFQPFQRLHNVQEYPGTGIGLATVSRIVRRHGGRVWAEASIDGGAAFYFTLGAE